MRNVENKTLDQIKELEREHVEVYSHLISTLDELYLLRGGYYAAGELNLDEKHLLEMRRQLQMSLDKSGAMLKTFQRLNLKKKKKNGNIVGLATDDQEAEQEQEQEKEGDEEILAMRLGDLMKDNFKLDEQLFDAHGEMDETLRTLFNEKKQHRKLLGQLTEADHARQSRIKESQNESQYHRKNAASRRDISTASDDEQDVTLQRENLALEELLKSMQVLTGHHTS